MACVLFHSDFVSLSKMELYITVKHILAEKHKIINQVWVNYIKLNNKFEIHFVIQYNSQWTVDIKDLSLKIIICFYHSCNFIFKDFLWNTNGMVISQMTVLLAATFLYLFTLNWDILVYTTIQMLEDNYSTNKIILK